MIIEPAGESLLETNPAPRTEAPDTSGILFENSMAKYDSTTVLPFWVPGILPLTSPVVGVIVIANPFGVVEVHTGLLLDPSVPVIPSTPANGMNPPA